MLNLNALSLIALILGAATVGNAQALDREAARDRLRTAREMFAEMTRLKAVYLTKKQLSAEINQDLVLRREVEANVRNLRITLDGFPARRNSIQQQYYQGWLGARSQLTEINRQIGACRAQIREIDEAVLEQAQVDGKRPGPMHRSDILTVYPAVETRCQEAFAALHASLAEVSANPQEVDRLLREFNGDLNRSSQIDARFGSPNEFLVAFRQSQRPASTRSKKPATR